jgi:glycerophosphoryl diester phosphodiesterase
VQDVGFNIEIKIATSAALQQTPLQELRRVVDPIIAVIKQNAGHRKVAVSSFDPDVMAYFEERRRVELVQLTSLSTWFLTEGPLEMLRRDPRRLSVSAAATFALQAQLTGIVVESSVASRCLQDVENALASGLRVCLFATIA